MSIVSRRNLILAALCSAVLAAGSATAQAPTGKLYGTTNDGSKGTVFSLRLHKENVLHTFGGSGDGFEPESGVTRDDAGNLYGTTNLGGASGLGTVYRITK